MQLYNTKLNTRIIKALAVMGFIINLQPALAVPVPGTVQCFDFSNLAVGTEYFIGSPPFSVLNGTVEFLNLYSAAGVAYTPAVQFANIAGSSIAGVAPELHQYIINMRVTPDVPVTSITMNYAQNTGGNQISNLEVNGERVQLVHGMASANGLVLGDNTTGQVQVDTTLVNPGLPPAQWINGTLTFTALTGGINSVTIGGVQTMLDDFCMTF